jgi:probable selenium-dependent hydroxylase accessory protein YqeC
MVQSQPLSQLAISLGLGDHEHIAIVGGGGKTTILHALARQLSGAVAVTCTTKMGHDQHRGLPVLIAPTTQAVARASGQGLVMIWKRVEGQKAVGVDPHDCDAWFGAIDHVVIEADGSRRKPFKAHAGYEPVVPVSATLMLSVIGADALGRVIADQCHRPLRVAALAGCSAYERLTPAAAAIVLLHERGARKELPAGADFAVAISKVDDASAPFVEELQAELVRRAPEVTVVPITFAST